MLLKEYPNQPVQFRDDILRGVRLFLIVFAAILTCVAGYRMLHTPADAQVTAQLEAAPAPADTPTTAQPERESAPATTPAADASSEKPHGLIVPPPPPVAGERVKAANRSKYSVPPPPPAAPLVARAKRAPTPAGREFETSQPGLLPVAPAEVSSDASPSTPKRGVGYKSLIEVDPNPVSVDLAAKATADAEEKPKGNRFFRAIGKIFHPGAKEPPPLTLQQPKQ